MKKFINLKLLIFLFSIFCFAVANFGQFEDNQNFCFATEASSEASQIEVSSEASQTDTVPSRNYTVVIDPGHGGVDVK